MTTNIERASLVSRQIELQSISLSSARVETSWDPVGAPPEVELDQGYRAWAEPHLETSDRLDVFVDLYFNAIEHEKNLVELGATYRLVYRLDHVAGFPSDTLQHFAELNGVLNAWPYWRELVQTVSGRVGLGSIVVPVFRPNIRHLTTDEEEQLNIQLPNDANLKEGE